MSMLPSFKAVLDDKLTVEQAKEVVAQIKKIEGVISVNALGASFNTAAGKSLAVTYANSKNVEENVRKIPGIKKTAPLHRM